MFLSDAHCHPQLLPLSQQKLILSSWKGSPLIASATQLHDTASLLLLQTTYPWLLPTFGWHPWYIPHNTTNTYIDETLEQFTTLLNNHSVPIGEVGLDWHPKWIETRKQQLYILEYFFTMANQLSRPIVVHCVRAHHEVLRLLKRFPNTRIYLHHFHGSNETYAQYLRYDVYFGLSILHWSKRHNELILSMPKERILFETDACVDFHTVQQLFVQNSVSSALIKHSYNNLFQFLQGTSDGFSQQFQISR